MAARTRGVSEDGELGVRFRSDSFIPGYEISTEVIRNAMNPLPLLVRILRHEPGGEKILQQLNDLVWLQIDPEKLPDWSLPQAAGATHEKRKYFGDQ